MYQKYFFQHLMVLCDFTAIWVLNTQFQKLQGKRRLEFYQRVFANLDGSQANRLLIKSLYGEFTQAGPENSSEGFTGHPGWAQVPSRSISPSQIHLTIQWVFRHYP